MASYFSQNGRPTTSNPPSKNASRQEKLSTRLFLDVLQKPLFLTFFTEATWSSPIFSSSIYLLRYSLRHLRLSTKTQFGFGSFQDIKQSKTVISGQFCLLHLSFSEKGLHNSDDSIKKASSVKPLEVTYMRSSSIVKMVSK